MLTTFDTSQLSNPLPLKLFAPLNMLFISKVLDVFQFPRFWSKLDASTNMLLVFVTVDISQFDMSELKLVAL